MLKSLFLYGLPMLGAIASVVLGALELNNNITLFGAKGYNDRVAIGASLVGGGVGVLGLTWLISAISTFSGIGLARVAVGLLVGGALIYALMALIVQTSVETGGKAFGYAIADIIVILMILFVLRKTFFHML